MVRYLLRTEGLVIFLLALYFYQSLHGNWLLFLLFLFVPDISMLGYVKDNKVGAILYNLVHNYILAAVLIVIGEMVTNNQLVTFTGIIVLAHVGLDRFLGFGLKYSSDFKHTHLQKV